MKIVILAAMDKEVALLKEIFEDVEECDFDGVAAYRGSIGGHDVVLAKCGIGKVNAALNCYKVIKAYHPQLVINSGVAGGAGGAKIGDLLVADSVAYYDVWCGPGTVYGAADGFEVLLLPCKQVLDIVRRIPDQNGIVYGLIVTGDKFVITSEEIHFVHAHFPDAVAVDMESAAIAQVCVSEGVDFNILRVVSDTPGEADNLSQYVNFWSDAPKATFACIKAILRDL